MMKNRLLGLLLLLPLSAHSGCETDLAYGREADQSLDIYYPDRCLAARCPVVMWVHGGGWRTGDKGNNGAKDLAATWENAGAVVVTLNYRLTPDVVHPAHVQDVAAGIAWTRANIGRYGGDPQRLFLLGHSAGAHLVALVATDPQYLAAHGLGLRESVSGVMPIDTASYDLVANNGAAVGRMIEDAFGTDPAVLRAHAAIARDLADADSHLARQLMRFVGLQ